MLEMLNKELSYEDIIYFRSLALVVMKRDQIVGRKSVPPAKKEPEIPQTQGWWSWITGGGTNSMQLKQVIRSQLLGYPHSREKSF